jgi:flagellar basal body rod protein FlgG
MINALSSYATAAQGMRRAVDNIRREAQTVARGVMAGSTADLTGAMARSLEQQRALEASAAALRRTDEARGSVIDILV